ncbi:hypothetical protein GE061_018244 [Apolygus lucorum]|uniref:Exonuclease domain-containing protein n=1 Tax=Apolygus lucorum TaxID=248454 RepID=A0A8S9XDC6_APOLU|nr:hypothetical protein GE061_018244 [Apolygus lucorum]
MDSTVPGVIQKTVVPLLLNYMPAIVTLVVAWITVSQFYFKKKEEPPAAAQNDARRRSSVESKPDKTKSQHSPVPAKSKKKQAEKWTGRDAKQNFAHEWLLTNLKGHTGAILDMDFSANGKFLATCADDDPGGTSGNSSGSEGNKENSSPRGGNTTLSRRQKKNRVRNSSPPTTTTSKKKHKKHCHTVLRQYSKLNLNESVYASLLVQNGSEQFGKVQEIKPVIRPEPECTTEEKKCVRCQKSFFITSTGEYLTQEHCMYHWGKLLRPPSGGSESFYSCCKAKKYTKGCSTGKLHVWSGVDPGRNGPFDGYVRTRPRKTPPPDGNYGVYALDCEMCYTTSGLELTKISVVAHDGRLVYDTYVKPESLIIDYNTRFSGVTAKDLNKRTKLLKDVQNDLMGFITADTILIGHGLENDLRALRMVHTTVVDTAIIFPHILGPPYRRPLKSLVYQLLKRDIQRDSGGHNSYEDACSCLELVLWKIRKDRQFRDELLLGKYRAVYVWSTRDWKEKEHKYIRYNVEYDHASLISWSPDSKAFVYNRSVDNLLEVCKLTKRPDGWIQSLSKAVTYPQGHKDETIGLGISSNGKYIMTCSNATDLILWDLKGTELARVDTYLMNNFNAKVSPCGTFVGASGFAPDVKVWQVAFTKSGEFKSISRAFELTGHTSGVYDFAFNADSSLMATVSKDSTWRLFNVKIEYNQGEEPHLIKTGKYKTDGKRACIALSPDGNVIALARSSSLTLVNALSGEVDKEIPNIYSGLKIVQDGPPGFCFL